MVVHSPHAIVEYPYPSLVACLPQRGRESDYAVEFHLMPPPRQFLPDSFAGVPQLNIATEADLLGGRIVTVVAPIVLTNKAATYTHVWVWGKIFKGTVTPTAFPGCRIVKVETGSHTSLTLTSRKI